MLHVVCRFWVAANGSPLSSGRGFETVSLSRVNGNAKVGIPFVSANPPCLGLAAVSECAQRERTGWRDRLPPHPATRPKGEARTHWRWLCRAADQSLTPILRMMEDLPPSQPRIDRARRLNPASSQVHDVISCLAWPRGAGIASPALSGNGRDRPSEPPGALSRYGLRFPVRRENRRCVAIPRYLKGLLGLKND
jgi:hypothetical protein